jgi:hypothetical protein
MNCIGDPLTAQSIKCWVSDIQNVVIKEYDITLEDVRAALSYAAKH